MHLEKSSAKLWPFCLDLNVLTHRGRVKSICANSTMPQHWFRLWLIACPAPSHYLKQCPGIINLTLRNPLGKISTKMQNTVCKMAAISSWPQCVLIQLNKQCRSRQATISNACCLKEISIFQLEFHGSLSDN